MTKFLPPTRPFHPQRSLIVSQALLAILDTLAAFYNVFDNASPHKLLNRIYFAIFLVFFGILVFFVVRSLTA